jgi:aminoglycoside phosphotransferase (APT) family kinase protein
MTNKQLLIEPRIAHTLERKVANSKRGLYIPKQYDEVYGALQKFMSALGYTNVQINNLKRMSGGASKEQFSYEIVCNELDKPKRLVLRMDPYESIVETCRLREGQLLRAISSVVPVPPVFAIDPEGEYMGQPTLITEFVSGVTKPTDIDSASVTGIGTNLGRYAQILTPQFIDNLAAIHSYKPTASDDLSAYVRPKPNTNEAPLYQIGWWSRIWELDRVEAYPMMKLVENWLIRNAPVCEDPCIVHGDYRIGNFMFEEPSGQISAVLDWEFAHLGDFHRDISWITQKLYGSWDEKGQFLVCGLLPKDEFLKRYEEKSGRKVDPEKIRYYEVMCAWLSANMCLGTTVKIGLNATNHQDLMQTWLSAGGPLFTNHMVDLIRGN